MITVRDDVVDSGVEESFGDVVLKSADPDLYDRICGCNVWPVQAELVDADLNTTSAERWRGLPVELLLEMAPSP